MSEDIKLEAEENPLRPLADISPDTPMTPGIAVASMALTMALKYHDMQMIPDGATYQQYKLEGRNIRSIGLADVFETAIQIEAHLIMANDRIGKMITSALVVQITEDEAEQIISDGPGEVGAPETQT